jgi:hypothetical protein
MLFGLVDSKLPPPFALIYFSPSEEEQQAWNTIAHCAACREGNQSVVKSLEGAFITVVWGSARGFVIIVVLLSCCSLQQVVQGFLSM